MGPRQSSEACTCFKFLGTAGRASCPSELRAHYEQFGQSHVLRFLDAGKLSEAEAAALVAQMRSIDVANACKSFEVATVEAARGAVPEDLTPPNADAVMLSSSATLAVIGTWEGITLSAIGRGEVAACVLAGGQGTRLGIDGPKGVYSIGLPSDKSLFQLMAERLVRLKRLAATQPISPKSPPQLPFLVMTSPINHMETTAFFKKNDFFGLDSKEVVFFQQGTLPAFTPDGKFILESPGVIATSPDGNGGIYPALQRSGTLAWLKDRGVKYLHIFGIDNAVVRPADPRFLGYCIKKGAHVGNKSVWKSSPGEKIGAIARRGDRYCVAEYSELDDTRKEMVDKTGKLVFGAGNICNHFFSVDFLADVVVPKLESLFHVAHKKIPFADGDGKTVKPTKNNGIKLEAFIFDVFPMAEGCKMAIFEVEREEFAPVKNPPGDKEDSPDTARQILNKVSRRWVEAAGGSVTGASDAIVEVLPLASYAGENLEDLCNKRVFSAPCIISPQLSPSL